jgi:hypothetical protein
LIWLILGGLGIALLGFLFGWLGHRWVFSSTYDGTVIIMRYPDGKIVYSLEFDKNPEGWQNKKEVLLEILADESIRNES